MFLRTRTVTLEGGDQIIIGELAWGQIEEFLVAQKDALEPKPDALKLQTAWRNFICTSLNNAGADPKWTAERIPAEMSLAAIQTVQREILELNGMGTREEASGEATAS